MSSYYSTMNCVRCLCESKEKGQKRASKQAVIRQAEKISCTSWIKITLYLIYIWVPLFIWRGQCWMEAPVLSLNRVSHLMNSKRGKGNSAGGEPGPSKHTRLLVTCLQFTFNSTQWELKWDKCSFHVCKWPPAATQGSVQGGRTETPDWILQLKTT